jgi:hypothetical protein
MHSSRFGMPPTSTMSRPVLDSKALLSQVITRKDEGIAFDDLLAGRRMVAGSCCRFAGK